MSESRTKNSSLRVVADGEARQSADATKGARVRMTGRERREQLISIGRVVFAEMGFEAASIEEIAERAKISKPVVYEHFGGKQGLYAVIVDREVHTLLDRIATALDAGHPRLMLAQAARAFLGFIEDEPDGFRILVRDTPVASGTGTLASVIGDIGSQVEYILVDQFKQRGFKTKHAPLYARALVGMVASVGEWWLDTGKPKRDVLAAHLVNLAWNGLGGLEKDPELPDDTQR